MYAVEIEAPLIPHGRRLRDLDIGEYLTWVYAWCVGKMDGKARQAFDYELEPEEDVAEEYSWLPPELQGERPPAAWALMERANRKR